MTAENEISEILNSLKSIEFDDLSSKYKESTKSDDSNYIKLLSSKRYMEITSDDFFKKLVGDFRIKNFVCKETYYNKSIRSNEYK